MGKFGPKKSKLFVLPENWHMEYLEDTDSYCDISFFEFPTLNLFLGKFGLEKSKLLVLPENQYIQYLDDADSYFDISFLKFQT